MKYLHLKRFIITLFFLPLIWQSCKKDDVKRPKDNQPAKIEGNWFLSNTKMTAFDKNGQLLFTDSAKTVKGYNDDSVFNSNGFVSYGTLVQYEIVKIKEEQFLKYAIYGKAMMPKLYQINSQSFALEYIDSTSEKDKTRIYRDYFTKGINK
ncbi:hypothetical protein [Pedobacter cryoconitis]|uniref:Uncharacterized protein n=1 Tax=Pedobacter cryoconitis TaxID=188932 RepID=A0A7X0MKU2_9SPHI|nr:hypothetical protein [Pedobacter cryoconitis]MBB6500808.1 hypothetical protein [Pedobacter cryoconitis]